MKIGILGGTFNPSHIGHLILAQEAVDKLGMDKIIFVPTNISPHKNNNGVSAADRFNMVKMAIRDNGQFEVSDMEIKRGGTSYTIDTVRELKSRYVKDELYLIIGSDLANTFDKWKESGELKKIIRVVVACRENYPLKQKDDFILMDITQIGISSSQIRELIRERRPINYLVRDSVLKYIKKNKLYYF